MQPTARSGVSSPALGPSDLVPPTYIARVSSTVLNCQGAGPSLLIAVGGIGGGGMIISLALLPSGLLYLRPQQYQI